MIRTEFNVTFGWTTADRSRIVFQKTNALNRSAWLKIFSLQPWGSPCLRGDCFSGVYPSQRHRKQRGCAKKAKSRLCPANQKGCGIQSGAARKKISLGGCGALYATSACLSIKVFFHDLRGVAASGARRLKSNSNRSILSSE